MKFNLSDFRWMQSRIAARGYELRRPSHLPRFERALVDSNGETLTTGRADEITEWLRETDTEVSA